ncbi:MAG: hypothetical protein IT320_13030 [Anaerolineae bacterium]|nr:hypothetical protein [Anaerolineae bacterium]
MPSAHQPKSTPEATHPARQLLPLDQRLKLPTSNYSLSTVCPACGTETFRHACKVRCPRCGFAWDCSEL